MKRFTSFLGVWVVLAIICGSFVRVHSIEMRAIKFTNCSAGVEPLSVKAGPCTKDPCTIKRSTKGEIKLKFVAPESSNKVHLGGKVIKDKVLPVNLPRMDLCKKGFLECPITANQTYTLRAKGAIPSMVPPGTYEGELWLEGDKGRLTCMQSALVVE